MRIAEQKTTDSGICISSSPPLTRLSERTARWSNANTDVYVRTTLTGRGGLAELPGWTWQQAQEDQEMEIWFDVRRVHVFDPDTGDNLTLASNRD